MENNKNFEWLNTDKSEIHYHSKQYEEPKLYTLECLEIFAKNNLDIDSELIVDFGCGGGAITNLFASEYPKINFLGLDVNSQYIEMAKSNSTKNATFRVFDLYTDISSLTDLNIDCLISFQTLSWLENYSLFLEMILNTKPKTVLVTSLFYDGDVDAKITIRDFTRKMNDIDYRESFYNIYSISRLDYELKKIGYKIDKALPFEINTDLPKPNNTSGMTTYTVMTEEKKRIQISGPILMSWYTLLIKRVDRI
jgi:SAM-dependent methyltransferase